MSGRRHADGRLVAVLFHESEVLGAGISLLRAAEQLNARGWSFAGWFPGAGPLLTESVGVLDGQGHHAKPLAYSLRGWRRSPGILPRVAQAPGYLRAFREWLAETNPRLVHANSLLMLPEATIAKRLGLPVVMHVHELRQTGLKWTATVRWASSVCEVMIAVSDAVAETLVTHARSTPVVTVRNGVPRNEGSRRAAEEGVVGTVGYVSRSKGTDVFLRAAALVVTTHPDIRFEHVGQPGLWGDVDFDRQIEQLASSPALRSHVTFLGRASVPDALARWQTFVLSSRAEGFPLGTLEAMAAGVPVIATRVGGIPEQIAHLETGVLIPPDDPHSLAEWIVRLHEDASLRESLGARARRRARDVFTLEAQADGLERAYEQALRRHEDRRGVRRRLRSASR